MSHYLNAPTRGILTFICAAVFSLLVAAVIMGAPSIDEILRRY